MHRLIEHESRDTYPSYLGSTIAVGQDFPLLFDGVGVGRSTERRGGTIYRHGSQCGLPIIRRDYINAIVPSRDIPRAHVADDPPVDVPVEARGEQQLVARSPEQSLDAHHMPLKCHQLIETLRLVNYHRYPRSAYGTERSTGRWVYESMEMPLTGPILASIAELDILAALLNGFLVLFESI